MQMNSVAIIVSSCDFFKDCWKPFIFSIQKYWADCPYPIYIVSNNDEIEAPSGISFIKVGEDKKFASNLRAALNQIDADYVIYLQEDYWLNKKVVNAAIARHLDYCTNNHIDYLRLTFPYLEGEDVGDCYKSHSLMQRYSICLQAAIWKRVTLLALLREGDSGWDFEYKIQAYAIQSHIEVVALGIKPEAYESGIRYVRGTAVRKGLWTIEGYKFLKENGFQHLLNKRKREGWFFGNIIDCQGPLRPLCLAIVKIMMKLKWNF